MNSVDIFRSRFNIIIGILYWLELGRVQIKVTNTISYFIFIKL